MTQGEFYYTLTQYKGKSLLEWALLWFRLTNDDFYMLYGFNFNPHEYPGLYEIARDKYYGVHKKTPSFLQKVFNIKK